MERGNYADLVIEEQKVDKQLHEAISHASVARS
jgi:hypothetical protein